jgi:hypothetical protein
MPSPLSRIAIIHAGLLLQGTWAFTRSDLQCYIRRGMFRALWKWDTRTTTIDYIFCIWIRRCAYQLLELSLLAVIGCAYERCAALHSAAQNKSSRITTPHTRSYIELSSLTRPKPRRLATPPRAPNSLILTCWKPHRADRPSQVRIKRDNGEHEWIKSKGTANKLKQNTRK